MTLGWVIVGFFGQSMLAVILAIFVFATASVIQQKVKLSEQHIKNLSIALLALPGLSIFAGFMLLWFYLHGADVRYYYWHLLPVVSAAVYLLYLTYLRLVCPKSK